MWRNWLPGFILLLLAVALYTPARAHVLPSVVDTLYFENTTPDDPEPEENSILPTPLSELSTISSTPKLKKQTGKQQYFRSLEVSLVVPTSLISLYDHSPSDSGLRSCLPKTSPRAPPLSFP
jgi:hypothetical protein